MIVDFRKVENGAAIETDLCVVGAGAAGITIAREFIGSKARLTLVESGGFELEDKTQALYRGEKSGLPYYDLDACRLRFFGGTTNHWGGECTPLSDIDFKARPWVPYSGWPITKADLEPFYKRAQSVLELGPYGYGEGVWRRLGLAPPAMDPNRIASGFWQLSAPTRFGAVYRREIERARNVTVLLNANVTAVRANAGRNGVRHLDVRTLQGKSGRIRSRIVVLACGGIETPRLLLLSGQGEPGGLGNRADLVGRFFMEHPAVRTGIVLTADPYGLLDRYRRRRHRGTDYFARLLVGEETQRRHGILNGSAELDSETYPKSGTKAVRRIWRDLKLGRWSDGLGEKVWNVVTDFGDVATNAHRRFIQGKEPIAPPIRLFLVGHGEQAPNPASRVVLSDERDALGLRRVRLEWRMTELDKRSLAVMTKAIAAEFGRLNLGRVRLDDWLTRDPDHWPAQALGSNHHIGTTRMADDPKKGVVDRHCRVHGIRNLYIAGSSVFPTSGYANPTLTIVALALRLSDLLKTRLP